MQEKRERIRKEKKTPGLSSLLRPYRAMIFLLLLMAILGNGVNLILPKIIAGGIDGYEKGSGDMGKIIRIFSLATALVFVFTYLQSIIQTFASERVARDLRNRLNAKISVKDHIYLQKTNPSRLLTNLTSDIDSIKLFVSMAIVSIASSIFIIIGVAVLLLTINWRLALVVLGIMPVIAITFFLILRKVRVLFKKSREVIDWLNKVINESILGSAIIRVLNSQQMEYQKFLDANTQAKSLGLSIMRLFAALIPVIGFSANMAVLAILALGGHFVIGGSMTLGDFAAFNSYLALLIFPILIIGFMSNVIAQATASYQRIREVLESPDPVESGSRKDPMRGDILLQDICLSYGGKPALQNISFSIRGGSKTAIIGPTAAGKTQLLYLMTGLLAPDSGSLLYDGYPLGEYEKKSFHSQVGMVFQDSILFNLSLRENIAFSENIPAELMNRAIATAELGDFIDSLPQGLETMVMERGTSLSGGQKQRIMLARALAINPRILLLDDFTSRVDWRTEEKIVANLERNYPGLTLVSVTQKIAPIEKYDEILLLMEAELIARGRHEQLMQTCPEYVQIYDSQRSTSTYELQS
jgi:ATP-binding cassette subfamily B protein